MEGLYLYAVLLIITIIIFLICREIVCWYWKINKSIGNQEKIIEQQNKVIDLLQQLVKQSKEPKSKPISLFGDIMGKTVKITLMSGVEISGTVEYNSDDLIIIRTVNGAQKIYSHDVRTVNII